MKYWTCAILSTLVLRAFAQTPAIDVRATGEYVSATGDRAEMAAELARMDALRKTLQQAAAHLRNLPEVKALQLSPAQIDAFAVATIEIKDDAAKTSTVANRAVYQVEALARLDADAIRRFSALRKDREAAIVIVETWKQIQELDSRLSETGKTPEERRQLLDRLRIKHLAAQIHAALAKTEEGPASRRESSPEGRDRARRLGEKALAIGPDSSEAHTAMGDVLLESGAADGAEAEYRKALLGDPGTSAGHGRLANALRLQGKLPEAVTEFREALRLDPNSALAHSDLALTFNTQKNAADAILEYREAIRLDPDSVDAHNGLAVALAGQRRLPAAVAEFREIIRIDPDLAVGHYNLALALADMDEDAESAAELREVIRINPNHYNAHYNLGELFRLEAKYDDSARQFREYLRLAPDTPQTQRNRRRATDLIRMFEDPRDETDLKPPSNGL